MSGTGGTDPPRAIRSEVPKRQNLRRAIDDTELLIVPTISIYEVFRRLRTRRDSEIALRGISQMR